MTTPPATPPHSSHSGHMIVCGNDPLTHRLALELIHLYGERLTLIVPDPSTGHGPQLVALATEDDTVRVIAGRAPDETTLHAAGIADAAAFAIVMDDDAAVVKTALLARGVNARLRLVIRVFNQRLGKRLSRLLEMGGGGSTAVLSASDMAAPALVSAALRQRRQVIPADGGTLSVFQVDEPEDSERNGTRLALLTEQDSNLLPADTPPANRADVTVIRLRHDPGAPPPARGRRALAVMRTVFSRRLQLAALGLLGMIAALTVATWETTGTPPPKALLLVLLDIGAAGNPAEDGSAARQVLQLLTIFTGVVFLGVVVALVLENLGSLRYGPRLRQVPRTFSGHVVLVGLGKVGTRVLTRLNDLRIPVVVVERNPQADGLSRARERNIPVVIGEFARYSTYREARVGRCSALMALTSDDSANLEAVLYAREHRPDLRVVLRLFDDDYSGTVYDALRRAHPEARTRSRSVSYLAAPSFAAAMMGRQVLAAIPVKRELLLVADIEVRPLPDGTLPALHREGAWRFVAVRTKVGWNTYLGGELTEGQRALVVATREGLGLLLQRQPGEPVSAPIPAQLPHAPRAEPDAPYPTPEELESESRRLARERRQAPR